VHTATGAALVIDNVVKIAVRMIDTIVDAMTDTLVSAANLRIDIVGRGADLVTVIIVSMSTSTTDIATSQDP